MTGRAFAVVTGGGTAGHVLPALAIAESLVDAGHDPTTIHYVGAARGIETRLVPATPFPHTFLDVVGLQRELNRRNVTLNATMVPKLAAATRRAVRLLRTLAPRVVVSVGGYASLPSVLAARRLRIPVVVVSYDLRPGQASKLAARFAAVSAVAYPGSPLPRAVVTGAPLRRRLRAVDRTGDRLDARRQLDLPADRFVVAVTGGSQGSSALNAAVTSYVRANATDIGLAVRQVVGERFLADVRASSADVVPAGGVLHQVIGYDDRIELTYAAADVLVGRGGASTVAEVAVTGTPSILVPWPLAAEDHQTLNVRWLSDQGGAILLPEPELGRLAALIDELRADPARLADLGQRAHSAGDLHRHGTLVEVIERVAAATE
ncbi:MAG: UDP-N-acetylglucosamine--N-acetylmuramyl-(pentapeptide) pyrophosphoryl-undecaprenol N-acetylglucosamine transferase [Ilumatobacteraceae bacterium]